MFMRNAWYVAAWDHEVTNDKPFGRIILTEPVVMYRKRDGGVVALEDRCCHRHYPLHRGTVVEDRIECAYHGFQYDGPVSAERKRSLFRKADGVICWYSELEACPVTVLEAVACGAYVLGSTRGPMPELIDPLWGRCCKDVEELKAAMEEPNIQSTGAQDVFNERFGERAMAEAYIALYEGVVASERW